MILNREIADLEIHDVLEKYRTVRPHMGSPVNATGALAQIVGLGSVKNGKTPSYDADVGKDAFRRRTFLRPCVCRAEKVRVYVVSERKPSVVDDHGHVAGQQDRPGQRPSRLPRTGIPRRDDNLPNPSLLCLVNRILNGRGIVIPHDACVIWGDHRYV